MGRWFAVIALAAILASSAAAAEDVAVPFVGCKADGQVGPLPAPKNDRGTPRLAKHLAARLAYYRADYIAVLAPRGRHCFSTYGSSSTNAFVTPKRFPRNYTDSG